MLKRVAVLVGQDEAVEQLAGLEGNLQFVQVTPGEPLPIGTVALLGSLKSEETLKACTEMGRLHETVLHLLADAIDTREGIMCGSGVRLRQHASRFAAALSLSHQDRMIFEQGALLRDIGKIRIPNDILLKKSVLTYDEWVLLQQHTTLGVEVLQSLNFALEVVDIVKYHHECWDGDGYPERLEREQIPYLARAMKIIDVYCAMTSPRHYRNTHSSHEDALRYLQGERGKHYDPQLIDIFLAEGVAKALHDE